MVMAVKWIICISLTLAMAVSGEVMMPMEMPAQQPLGNITATLAQTIHSSSTAPFPETLRALARSHLLDTLASVVACRHLETAVLARELALSLSGAESPSAATVLGSRARVSVTDAAFAGAMAGHGAEINDFVPSAYVQPGPAIVAVALALAETRKLSGDAVLRALIVGYEVASRVPKALGIKNLSKAGLANHGIGPTFGAAAAAASLLRLTPAQIGHMLSYCAQQASGSWQWMLDVEHIEKSFVFAGMGARAGLNAALMAEIGFRGVRDSFDDPKGWFHAKPFTGGDEDPASLLGVDRYTELLHTGFKRYPVGGPTQPSVHAMLMLLPEIKDVARVTKVTVAMPGAADAFRNANMPALNLKYLLAIILLDGKLDFVAAQSRERMLNDETVHQVMEKVMVEEDAAQEAPKGEARRESARVTVEEVGGQRHEVFVPYVVGYPSHPMGKGEVEEKAFKLMEPLGVEKARDVVALVNRVDELTSVDELIDLIAR